MARPRHILLIDLIIADGHRQEPSGAHGCSQCNAQQISIFSFHSVVEFSGKERLVVPNRAHRTTSQLLSSPLSHSVDDITAD